MLNFFSFYLVSIAAYFLFYGIVVWQWRKAMNTNKLVKVKISSLLGPDFSCSTVYRDNALNSRRLARIVFWGLVPVANAGILGIDVLVNLFAGIFYVVVEGYEACISGMARVLNRIHQAFDEAQERKNVLRAKANPPDILGKRPD